MQAVYNKLWYAYKRVQPLLIQNFVVAEGANFTLPEVDTALSGARITGKDEQDMLILSNTINAFRVLNVMLRNNMFDISDKSVFLKLQFFFDGNKRTSRLMAYGHLVQNGLMPFSLEESILLDYNIGMLKYYDTDDMTDVFNLLGRQQEIWQYKYNEL